MGLVLNFRIWDSEDASVMSWIKHPCECSPNWNYLIKTLSAFLVSRVYCFFLPILTHLEKKRNKIIQRLLLKATFFWQPKLWGLSSCLEASIITRNSGVHCFNSLWLNIKAAYCSRDWERVLRSCHWWDGSWIFKSFILPLTRKVANYLRKSVLFF